MTAQDELIEALEKGDGRDIALDAELAKLAGVSVSTFPQYEPDGALPGYTASLDAALSLVERMLPGCEYNVTNLYGVAAAELPLNSESGWETGRHKGGSLPRAVLIALLRALATDKEK